jgi:dolichol kinase
MGILAFLILAAVVCAALYGAAQIAFWLIIGSVVYLCICGVIDKVKSWLQWP